jgi:hypothetical protein
MIIGLAVPHPLTTDDGSSSPPPHRGAPRVRPEDAGKWAAALPGKPEAAVRAAAGATWLRCGGCQASGLYRQDEHCYGGLVHAFLTRHERCGNAVAITRVRGGR